MSLQQHGIEMKNHAEKGRGLFASQLIKAGSVVFEEDPIVSCQFTWNQDLGYKACDHCLRPLETAEENVQRLCQDQNIKLPFYDEVINKSGHVRCQCQAVYCTEDCRVTALAQYHSVLCALPGTPDAKQLTKLREIWKKMHYPPESAAVMLILRIYALVHQAIDKKAIIAEFQQFASDASNNAVCDKLLGKFRDKVDSLRGCVVECVNHLNLDIPEGLLSPQGFLTTLSILALNGQGVGTSSFSLWVQKAEQMKEQHEDIDGFIDSLYSRMEETVGMEFLDNEGSGLYRLQSKINHSCEPNLEIVFPNSNHRVGVKTVRDIQPGEELLISYLEECQLERSRHSRQKIIREKHLFVCLCTKCERQAGEPDVTSDEDEEEMDED